MHSNLSSKLTRKRLRPQAPGSATGGCLRSTICAAHMAARKTKGIVLLIDHIEQIIRLFCIKGF